MFRGRLSTLHEARLYSIRPMNTLIVGSDRQPILRYIPNDNFLLIDDGPICEAVAASGRTVRVFDVENCSFNPLKDIDYRRAREFAATLFGADPGGDTTLTVRNGKRALTKLALKGFERLDRITGDRKDPATAEALGTIDNVLLSPVLERVLNRPSNFSPEGTIIARLDRAALGDFDCFVLANLLVSLYPGQVVIPDFGFYACGFHTTLIRQRRLIAGITSFDEVPRLRNQLLQIPDKIASCCTPDDAAVLARYAGIVPNSNAWNDFIETSIRPTA